MNGTEVTRQCKPCPGRHVDNEAAALLLASEFVQIKDTGSQQIPLPPLWSHTESLLQLEDTCVQGKTRDATQQWQRRMNWCSCKNALNSCRVVKKQLKAVMERNSCSYTVLFSLVIPLLIGSWTINSLFDLQNEKTCNHFQLWLFRTLDNSKCWFLLVSGCHSFNPKDSINLVLSFEV